ncbi:MAG: septation regulator SpoVG [Treponema sp.]
MQITNVQIRKVVAEDKLKAYAAVTFDDCFVIHNVKIIERSKGLFVAMPSRKTKTGEYKDIAHPVTPEFRQLLQEKIMEAFYTDAHC